jgi:hypothetical protein
MRVISDMHMAMAWRARGGDLRAALELDAGNKTGWVFFSHLKKREKGKKREQDGSTWHR